MWGGRPGKLDVSSLQGEMRETEGSRRPLGRPQTLGRPPEQAPERRPPHGLSTSGQGLAGKGGQAPPKDTASSHPGHPPTGRGQTRALAPVLTQCGLPPLPAHGASPFVPQPVSPATA